MQEIVEGQEIWSFIPNHKPEKGIVIMQLCKGVTGEYESLYECMFCSFSGAGVKYNLFSSQIYDSRELCTIEMKKIMRFVSENMARRRGNVLSFST